MKRRNRYDIILPKCIFIPLQQTVALCETDNGEIQQTTLFHNLEQVRRFYSQLPNGVVGVEVSCSAAWFEQMLSELGHELKVGNPTLIRARARSRHKSDKRDADLILDLPLKNEFPALWRRSMQSLSVLEQLRFRHQLVKPRTQVCNRLQALAHLAGLPKPSMQTKRARRDLTEARLSETQAFQPDQLFEILDDLTRRIKRLSVGWKKKPPLTEKFNYCSRRRRLIKCHRRSSHARRCFALSVE